ncbi:MAG TPA: virion core protein (lumpy skin disease virus), partial [Ruminococcaceae bacterium]|nr:virion core protein (lumpy skin disease virus) [Oscillospiraceae bacterium]
MGLIKAALGSAGGVLAEQWKEFFYCDALPADVLMRKGHKRVSGRSSNTKGKENIITNGSVIAVADGQCMLIVDQGKIVDLCAEPGEYVYDMSTEPSVFYGDLGKSIQDVFANIGKRFTFGGEPPKDQRIYYINIKEILNNKFGTPTPILFEVVNKAINMHRTVNLRFNGVYSYIISDPLLFYTRLCGNVEEECTRDLIDGQLKADFMDALQPAVGALAEQELRPAQIPAKAKELKTAMNAELQDKWGARGISIASISLNPITLSEEDMKKIQEIEDAATFGSSANMMAGRMTDATASAMQTAAGNTAGAMTGFMGMGMAGGMTGGGFGAAQNMYAMGQQQAPSQQLAGGNGASGWTCSCGAAASGNFCPECGKPKPAGISGWTCSCGKVNKGKFCTECGKPKPAGVPQYKCDKCGWEPA